MKTDEQIKEALEDAFEEYTDPDIKIRRVKYAGKQAVELEISSMYESPTFKAKSLLDLANLLIEACGGHNVDIIDEVSYGGCETCDYGSSYGKVYRIW